MNLRLDLFLQKKLFTFLYEKIASSRITDKELEYKLAIACEKGFTENRLVITLRAAYQVLVEKYDQLIENQLLRFQRSSLGS